MITPIKENSDGRKNSKPYQNQHEDHPINSYHIHKGPCHSENTLIEDCPSCGYKCALSITVKNGKRLYYCHVGCDQLDLWTAMRNIEGGLERKLTHHTNLKSCDKSLNDYMQKLWQSSLPVSETLVATYLSTRGIALNFPDTLRFLMRHQHRPTGTYWPVMLAGVTNHAGNLHALHRTYLAVDGMGKAPVSPQRMTLGPVTGCAVHLAKASQRLAIAEGLETGLSIMMATGIPTWSALSAGGIKNLILPPLPLASEVLVCADNDENGVGQSAAEILAARCFAEGRRACIVMPPTVGQDFNDLLREVAI